MQKKKIKVIFKAILICLILFNSCEAQNKNNLIGTKYKYTVELALDKLGNVKDSDIWISNKISKFLKLNTQYFTITGGGGFDKVDDLSIAKIVPINSENNQELGNEVDKYLFIEKKTNYLKELTDTIKIKKGQDYSLIKYKDGDEEKPGIGIGKYSIDEKMAFFKLKIIYGIDSLGKLFKLPLNTLVYDCVPDPYYTEEDPEVPYLFGVSDERKYERFWNEENNEEMIKRETGIITGSWFLNCNVNNSGLEIFNNKGILVVVPPAISIYVNIVQGEKDNIYYLKYDGQDMNLPLAQENVIDKNVSRQENIGKIEKRNDELIFTWYGLYNSKTKEKINLISQFNNYREEEMTVVLKRCK